MTTLLLILLLITGFITLQVRDLLHAVIFLAVFSLLSSLLLYVLHAPDVAIAEAAVGAGISTFVFTWIVRRTKREDTE